ncbi:hypothetical protein [Enterovibrio norvegicus]|uniref:hypothetical protein n=1 Tax=Enterovibrio norvegicus TaxID=188144 RepID=UPI000C858284|nr:hypothetical protein [Enterovibrio norvegicus]PMH64526.1 hypothetical protein BCU62_15845 [Enterovibrio norvegicus]
MKTLSENGEIVFLSGEGFTFLTSDTREVIPRNPDESYWVLKKDGSYEEVCAYDRFGRFTRTDGTSFEIFEHFVDQNFNITLDKIPKLAFGQALTFASYYVEAEGSDTKYACKQLVPVKRRVELGFKPTDLFFKDFSYEYVISGVLSSMNEHIVTGRLIPKRFKPGYPIRIVKNPKR